MSQSTEVFTRKTSGLVRVMSPYSAFAYNVLAIGILFPWVYLTASYAFPRANIPLGIIITGILLIPMWFCYSHLAASMPRSGGDYVFQSRILSGPVGFTATMIPAWFVMYLCFAGWMLCATGLSPMLGVLGFRSGNLGLYRAAEWFSGATGTIILSIVCLTGAILIFIMGMKWFVKIQWFLWYGLIVSLVALVYVLATTTPGEFIERFNAFYAWAAPHVAADGGFYQYILDRASSAGVNLSPGFSWVETIGVSTVAANSLVWAILCVQQLGEIKGANQVRNTSFFIVGSGVFSTLMMALLAFLLFKVVGTDFIIATGHAYMTGSIEFPIQPWLGMLAAVSAMNPVLVFFICMGFILNAFQVFCNVIIQVTRITFAASLDGLFPNWFCDIHPKYRAPVKLYAVYFVWFVIWILLYNLWPSFYAMTLSVAAAFCGYFILTCLSGAMFPYLNKVKAIYQASPITGYRIGNIPLITIFGVFGAIVNLVILLFYLFVPELGVQSTVSLSAIGGFYVFFIIYYYARRAYLQRRGINIDLVFQQLSPE